MRAVRCAVWLFVGGSCAAFWLGFLVVFWPG